MFPCTPYIARPLRFALVLAAAVAAPARAGDAAPRGLRIALVSGANESKPYSTDAALRGLAGYLESEAKMSCKVLTYDAAGGAFREFEHLLEADAAVFFVRRRKLAPEQLEILRRFVASGRGFVALRSTSHGWEDWPEFDVEILGARYGRNGTGNFGDAERLLFKPHPIWEGVVNSTAPGVALTTRRDLYRYEDPAPDLDIILEGETKRGRTPVAWTRMRGEGRLFYVALGYADEVAQPGFRRMVRNALYWVTRTPPPVEKPAPKKVED